MKYRKDNNIVNEERFCVICGKKFITCKKRMLTCSKECSKKRYSVTRGPQNARQKARANGVYYEPVNPLKVFKRDGWKCQQCGKKLNIKNRGTIMDDAPELDHILPWSQGGEHSYKNTQLLCRKCNQEKGATPQGQMLMFG
jgi:5-methylcytosine-specific restriction endonuclease McrA